MFESPFPPGAGVERQRQRATFAVLADFAAPGLHRLRLVRSNPCSIRVGARLVWLSVALVLNASSAPLAADTLLAMSTADPSFSGVSAGGALEGYSGRRQISDDGRWIAFVSVGGPLLLDGYTGSGQQVYLADRLTRSFRLVSAVSGSSAQGGNGASRYPEISPDGRYVAFASESSNLVPDYSGEMRFNVYVWDRDAPPSSALRLVSHTPEGPAVPGNERSSPSSISADGRYVAYLSAATDLLEPAEPQGPLNGQVFVWDREAPASSANRLVSHVPTNATKPGDDRSYTATLSADGRYVAYTSFASDLIAGATGDESASVYLWDRDAPTATANRLVSHTPAGATVRGNYHSNDPRMSLDGRYLAFASISSDLIAGGTGNFGYNVYLWDRDAPFASAMRLVSHTAASATERAGGTGERSHSLSLDGRYMTYRSWADDLLGKPTGVLAANVYQWDREAPVPSATRLVSHAPEGPTVPAHGESDDPAASSDGRFVAYRLQPQEASHSGPYPGPPPMTDVYLWDREAPVGTANRLLSHVQGQPTSSANGNSEEPAVSGNGSVTAFTSDSTDLIAGDSYFRDVFAASSSSLGIELISARGDGIPWPPMTGNNYSSQPYWRPEALSADGRYAVFHSSSTDLMAGLEGPAVSQLYLWDLATRVIRLVSHTPSGALVRASEGGASAVISANGRFVAYQSRASDLVAGASGGTDYNIYLWDRDAPAASATRLVSHTPAGSSVRANDVSEHVTVSADGRYVAYDSESTDLVEGGIAGDDRHIYLWDREAPTASANRLVSHTPAGPAVRAGDEARDPELSRDGRFVGYASEAVDLIEPVIPWAISNAYVWDRDAPFDSATRLVSHGPAGATIQGDNTSSGPIFSESGRYLAFSSRATNLVEVEGGSQNSNVYLWDRLAPASGATRLVSHRAAELLFWGNGASWPAAVSADGRYVAYGSAATDLVTGATGGSGSNVYIWDAQATTLDANRLVSHTPAGATIRGNRGSGAALVSDDFRFVVYLSAAENLVAGETGPPWTEIRSWTNVYRWDREASVESATILISHAVSDAARRGAGDSEQISMSANGRAVVFQSDAPDLVLADLNEVDDSFWWSDLSVVTPLFADGFENGDTAAWSAIEP